MASFIKANGIEMSYQLDGPANAPVLMLSNSLLTDFGMWDLQVPAFAAKYRLLRYDTRGHGGTEATPGPYTIDLLASDVIALLDALRIDKVAFLGLSMGGMIAQCLAAKHSSRLKRVVLCDTACHLPPESAWDDRIALAQSKGTSAFIKPMTERWLTQPYRERNPAQMEKMGAMIPRTAVNGLVGCAHAIKKMNQANILANIKMPTLIVVGEQDVGTPVSAAEFLNRGIAGSKLVVIKNAGHLPNIEQTDIFNQTVLEFLGAH
jgi:3-oxoadipate enol-lactonase